MLEALRYSSLPAFTWDAMLRFTDARPDLIQDVDMYEFYELGIRGQCLGRACLLTIANLRYDIYNFLMLRVLQLLNLEKRC